MFETIFDVMRLNPLVFTSELPGIEITNRIRVKQIDDFSKPQPVNLLKRILDLEEIINSKKLKQ